MDKKNEIGVTLGTCKINATRTKYFFQKDGQDLEFYIDRDPSTGLATLWIRPGYTDAMGEFITALFISYKQAQAEENKDLTSKQ